MDISIIVPTIRPLHWRRLYDSISLTNIKFELIFIGPDVESLKIPDIDNIIYINDLGSPARAMNIGLVNASGKYVSWAADDGWFLGNELQEIYKKLLTQDGMVNLITSIYLEGSGDGMLNKDYYLIKKSIDCSDFTNKIIADSFILNIGLIEKNLLTRVGGWNGEDYETPFASHLDLAIRLHEAGILFHLHEKPLFTCTHMPGTSGDHAPIHHAHYEDMEILKNKYRGHSYPINIDLDNYKRAPERWTRRFGNV